MGHLLRPHECRLCTHNIAKLNALWLLLDDGRGPYFFQMNPPSKISGYGPGRYQIAIENTCQVSYMYKTVGHVI